MTWRLVRPLLRRASVPQLRAAAAAATTDVGEPDATGPDRVRADFRHDSQPTRRRGPAAQRPVEPCGSLDVDRLVGTRDLPVHGLEGAAPTTRVTLLGVLRPPPLDLAEDVRASADGAGLLLTDPGLPPGPAGWLRLTPLRPAAHGSGRASVPQPAEVSAVGPSVAVAFRRSDPRRPGCSHGPRRTHATTGCSSSVSSVTEPLGLRAGDLVRSVVARRRPRRRPLSFLDPRFGRLVRAPCVRARDVRCGAVRDATRAGTLRRPFGCGPLPLGAADDDLLPAESLAALRASVPAGRSRGAVVLLSGLSGSGKSTIARALADRIEDSGQRRVTLLTVTRCAACSLPVSASTASPAS